MRNCKIMTENWDFTQISLYRKKDIKWWEQTLTRHRGVCMHTHVQPAFNIRELGEDARLCHHPFIMFIWRLRPHKYIL